MKIYQSGQWISPSAEDILSMAVLPLEKAWQDETKRKEADFVLELLRDEPDFVFDCCLRAIKDNRKPAQKTLDEEIAEVSASIRDAYKHYEDMTTRDRDYEIKQIIFGCYDVEGKEKKLARLKWRERVASGKVELKNGVTDEMILRARQYPISEMIEINSRGYAHCVNHKPDRHPSMFCRGGFVYCFVCQFTADSIDLAMKLFNLSFPEAVKRLAGR